MTTRLLKYYIFLISVFLSIGCTTFSIDYPANEKPEQVIYQENFSLDLKGKVIIGDNQDVSESKAGHKILSDLGKLSSVFKRDKINEVIVKIKDYSKNPTGCITYGCLAPIFYATEARILEIEWIEPLQNQIINSQKVEYRTYSSSLLFPIWIYKVTARAVKGKWDSELGYMENVLFYGARLDHAVYLNSMMVKDIISNNYQIPSMK